MPVPTATPAAVSRDRACTDAGAAAAAIAARVSDPEVLAAAIEASTAQAPAASSLPWRPASLAQGHAGIALLCAALDAVQPDGGWDRTGHRQLEQAARAAGRHDASLFSGLAGIGFAATALSAGRPRYHRLLAGLDAAVEPLLDGMLYRLDGAHGCRVSEIDLVSGPTGVGAYLLDRPVQQGGPLRRLLGVLADLLADTGDPRRWHTPAALTTGPLREAYPGGLHNCGLAHGVPGPLALLSLAHAACVRVPRQEEAIACAANWLVANRTGTAADPGWPDGVQLAGPPAADRTDPGPGRAAWCYGAPGVARSLWLAGVALGERSWMDLAATTVRAVAQRPPQEWLLSTPTFCHGSAGLLQVLRRFAADLADPAVGAAADTLAATLAAGVDPQTLVGVRAVHPGDVLVDQPGLLDGASGVALALLGTPTPASVPGRPAWDRMFLLG